MRGAEPCDFETMQNGERFQARALNGGWQVYGAELEHIAMCDRPEYADMIAKALNDAASQKLDILGKSDVKWFSGNLHYSITGEGIKPRPVDCD